MLCCVNAKLLLGQTYYTSPVKKMTETTVCTVHSTIWICGEMCVTVSFLVSVWEKVDMNFIGQQQRKSIPSDIQLKV